MTEGSCLHNIICIFVSSFLRYFSGPTFVWIKPNILDIAIFSSLHAWSILYTRIPTSIGRDVKQFYTCIYMLLTFQLQH